MAYIGIAGKRDKAYTEVAGLTYWLVRSYFMNKDYSEYVEKLKCYDYNVLRLGKFNKYKWLYHIMTFDIDDNRVHNLWKSNKCIDEAKKYFLSISKEIVNDTKFSRISRGS